MNGPSSRPQRSSSTSRSRRATLSVGPNGSGGLPLSLSPQRAMRTRVLREKSNEPSGDVGAVGKTKEVVAKGATRAQQLQFAFGSKIVKPSTSSKSGMSAAGAGMPTRGRAGAVAADAAGPARSRRERSAKHEPQEQQQQQQQRASSRGRGAGRAEHHHPQQQPGTTPREQAGATVLKAQLEEQEATIAELRKKLAEESAKAEQNGKSEASATDTLKVDGVDELNEGEQATLRAVEEEARAEAEEKLVRVEAVAGAGLAHLEEMQARVDEMIRDLRARRS